MVNSSKHHAITELIYFSYQKQCVELLFAESFTQLAAKFLSRLAYLPKFCAAQQRLSSFCAADREQVFMIWE
jgi:hypothetical protein